jgi:hypothetical protein
MITWLLTMIVRVLIVGFLIILACVFFVSFLNRRSSQTDSKMYDPKFNPSDELNFYRTEEEIDEEDANNNNMGYYRLDAKRKH